MYKQQRGKGKIYQQSKTRSK